MRQFFSFCINFFERIVVFLRAPMTFYRATWWRELLWIIFPFIVFWTIYLMLPHWGYLYTWTNSLPIGVWRYNNQGVKSDYVAFCLPDGVFSRFYREKIMEPDEKGPCVNNMVRLIKPVMAREGDHIELTMASVLVNNVPLPNMLTKEGSTKHKIKVPRVPRGKYIVKPGTVWVFSSYNVRSYDSRYFGAIDIKQIYSGVEPVFVFSTNTDYVLKTSATPYCFWRLCWFSYPVAQR